MGRTAFNVSQTLLGPRYSAFNGAAPVQGVDGILRTVVSSRSTVNTPNFGSKKKPYRRSNLSLPNNPFSFKREVITGGFGDLREHEFLNPAQYVTESGYHSGTYGNCTGGVVIEPDADTKQRLQEQVIAKLLEKLKNQSVNLAQVFAERKLTADLIGDTAIRLASSFSSLKKGDFREAAKRLGVGASRRKTTAFNRAYGRNKQNAISNGWLELQYGWRPLLQDIYGSAEFLAKKQCHEIHAVVRSKQTRRWEEDTLVPDNPNYWDVLTTKRTQFDYSGSILFQTTGAELATAKEAGLINPLSLAWELTPYSFVVDWFIPIGNYLNSLDATLGLEFQSGSFTTFLRGTSAITLTADNRRAASRYYSSSVFNCRIKSSRTKVECIRTPLSAFPTAYPPRFKNPFSFEHAANGIALLFQTFKR